ncbi:hypothetical protein JCM11251_001564 [Rhodosporidiobolus azoricus]
MATQDPTLLLQDLLSPPSPSYPPSLLLPQLTLHLGSIPLPNASAPSLKLVELLARYAASSPALWDAPGDAHELEKGWDTNRAAFEAMRNGVLLRLEELSRPPSSSTSTSTNTSSASSYTIRRIFHSFLASLLAGLTADASPLVQPEVRLALMSGVLSALQEWKRRKEKIWVGGGKGIEGWEGEVGKAWKEYLEQPGVGEELFPAWLAAHTLPLVEAEVLAKSFSVPPLLRYLTTSFSALFSHGLAFSAPPLSADLSTSGELLTWATPSPSHTHLSSLVSHPLFTLLGPLSRAIGRTIEAAAIVARTPTGVAPDALAAIQHISAILLRVTTGLNEGWAATAWSDLLSDDSLSPSTRTETAPWTLLKTLLFAQTLIYSSLLQVVAPSEGDEPTPVQRQLATQAVRALGKSYFVALKFGQNGFDAWRAVLGGLVEVVAAPRTPSWTASPAEEAGEESPAETLAKSLEPVKGTGHEGRHNRAVERAEATFWMNTVELVMAQLGEGYVEKRVLRGVRPYLDDATYRDSFEAAHSVMLAFFGSSTATSTAHEVAPWYIELLLRTYPSLLSPSQFRLAYSAVVAAVSSTDDALACWAVEELLAKVEGLPIPSSSPTSSKPPSTSPAPANSATSSTASPPLDSTAPPPPPSAPASTLDSLSLSSPYTAYLLTLTHLLPSLSLALLPTTLSHLSRLIRLLSVEAEERRIVAGYFFEVLGERMDAVKREVGTRWWMENGEGVVMGEPLLSEEVEQRAEEKMASDGAEEVGNE